jgi:hypothetical protein
MSRANNVYIHQLLEPGDRLTTGRATKHESAWVAKNRELAALREQMGEDEWYRRVQEDKEHREYYIED